MALLHAAAAARQEGTDFPQVEALTVDHGLRAESASEATFVCERCVRLGIPHRTVRLDAQPPSRGIQQWARDQRLRVFREAGRTRTGTLVLTAHQANDADETNLMRSLRKGNVTSPRAVGIAPYAWFYGTWLYRPLLRFDRETLRAFLYDRGADWIEDPSNEDASFERVRARTVLAVGADRASLPSSDDAGTARQAAARAATPFLRDHVGVRRNEGGDAVAFVISAPANELASDPTRILCVRALCGHLGAHDHLPSAAKIARMLVAIAEHGGARGVARCLLRTQGARLLIEPERRGDRPGGAKPTTHPWPQLVPAHDLSLANTLFALLGADPIPAPPVPSSACASGRT